jgi:hypothetical protein
MGAIIYIVWALTLIRYCVSPSYRAETRARWKKTPTHRIVYEVGGGILGLVIMGATIAVIVVNSKQDN